MIKKYPIGTKIKYIANLSPFDTGKCGWIVGYPVSGVVEIVIPDSRLALDIYDDSLHSWTTHIESIEILSKKNEQLLFEFMYE